ncbi:single-stranded-DNA-specific exonuclease RecJ, partial [filamentous cyanobacterium CCP5]
MPRQRWQIAPAQTQLATELGAHLDLPPLLAQVLINRGIVTDVNAREFLEPETQQLPSPILEFPDLALSLELLEEAIATGTRIAICGDYDADGMTSTALLIRALRFLGAQVNYAIPSRMSEGYGINERIVEDFYAEGIGVILTVDNGIAAYAPIARARELGLTVIVTDHHDIPERLPPASAILNPKLLSETSPYRGVAGVGVAYVLAVCLAQALGKTRDLTAPLLELFTLGTIADLAPLTGVNRRWVRRGLGLLANSRIVGVQALIQVAGLGDADKTLKPEDIGFRLGPRINAVGRISDPQIVIDLLTTEDVGVAIERAMQCEQINQTRRDLCTQIEQEAVAWCEAQQQAGQVDLKRDRVLLVIQPDWHHGVIGIVASRLVERYGVPVFIGTYEDEVQKVIRGSARGIPEFHVFEALQACDDLLEKYGGHRAAGGFSFPAKHLRQVKSRLVNFANQQLDLEHIRPLVTIDVQANLADISLDLYEAINRLHPCGIENNDPVFWSANVQVKEQKPVGRQQDHLKLVVSQNNGPSIKAIAWRWGEYCPLPDRLDIAYRLRLNEWQGSCNVELELVGARLPQGPFRSKDSPQSSATSAAPSESPHHIDQSAP